jgi:hypothetical protein
VRCQRFAKKGFDLLLVNRIADGQRGTYILTPRNAVIQSFVGNAPTLTLTLQMVVPISIGVAVPESRLNVNKTGSTSIPNWPIELFSARKRSRRFPGLFKTWIVSFCGLEKSKPLAIR